MSTTERLVRLAQLDAGWDGHSGKAPTAQALSTAESMLANVAIVPCSDGSLQLEWHQGGADLEIEINAEGRICGASFSRAG